MCSLKLPVAVVRATDEGGLFLEQTGTAGG